MFWTNPIKCKCCNKRESSMKMDINSGVYATYSRGEDGEGEYGDGDKVYFNDSNVYYGVDNENQGKDGDCTTDRNSNYSDN